MSKAGRLKLQAELEKILGSEEAYFQPPASIKLSYPAIVYKLNNINVKHANGFIYKRDDSYSVTLIDTNPESEFVDKILQLPKCRFDRFYIADNLNHWTFTIYN